MKRFEHPWQRSHASCPDTPYVRPRIAADVVGSDSALGLEVDANMIRERTIPYP